MSEVDFDIDKEMEHRLRWRWFSKWRMLRQIRKVIAFADESLKDDLRFLNDAIEEKNKQLESIRTAKNEKLKARYEMIYEKECEMERILNLIGFIDLNSIDIYLLSEKMIKDKNKWSRNLYARYSYMMMYELTEDVTQLLGNDKSKETRQVYGIRRMVEWIGDNQLTEELNKVARLWNDFWKKICANGRNFSQIRNVSTAHRDHDFKKQYEIMTKVSWGEALNYIVEFSTKYMILRMFIVSFMQKYSVKYNEDVKPLMDELIHQDRVHN